jgi:hypothetical protein
VIFRARTEREVRDAMVDRELRESGDVVVVLVELGRIAEAEVEAAHVRVVDVTVVAIGLAAHQQIRVVPEVHRRR